MGLHERRHEGEVVERIFTADGSVEDQRLDASTRWTRVEAEEDKPDRPADSDVKATWKEYAIVQGVPSYRVDNMTKDQLIQEVG